VRVKKAVLKKGVEAGDINHPMAEFFALKFSALWGFFRREHFSFWAACGYLVFEYVRPQSIFHQLDIVPWSKVFILLAIVGGFADRSARWVSAPTNKWMICYLIVIVISSQLAFRPDISNEHFMDFFEWFLIYFITINVVNSEKRLFIYLLFFILATYKMSFHGARTWVLRGFAFETWGLQGPSGPFENSGEFAVQMLMMLPIAYRLSACINPWLTRFKYRFMLGAPVTAALTIVGASSRGSQLSLLFQAYHTFLRGRLNFKSLALASAAVVLLYLIIPTEQLDRFRAMGGDDNSRQRLIYWKRGVEMIQEHPVFGVGFFNFAPYFDTHYSSDIKGKAELPHNIFVQVGTDAGIVGLAAYVAIILSGFGLTRSIRRRLKDETQHWLHGLSYGYDAAMVGFLIAGQFVTIGYYPFMWVNLAFMAATRNIVFQSIPAKGRRVSSVK
jgi:putative inorganic carbon (hco3(-)) transporter